MNLAVDIGNTRIKLALFQEDKLLKEATIGHDLLITEINELIKEHSLSHLVLSSVAKISEDDLDKLKSIVPVFQVTHESKVPFQNLYKTPKTLGIDRIALVAAASAFYEGKNVLIIDAGTCITYDFLSAHNQYLCGAISPGLQMRYKALHEFTANLPLLESDNLTGFIGNSTTTSIHSGVVNGLLNEIEGVIQQYEDNYPHLTVVLTGGDSNFLSKQLKSSIFATQNFLLVGLNKILILNRNL